ncbi:uncharacterized protein [Argopecten irradians]|uniref:uncharacterized protein n=1 Tax=Argopecten irradians TaxID=31199 RepID=UPI00371D7A53
MSTGEPLTRHKVFPPQRMHTRSRSNVNQDTVTENDKEDTSGAKSQQLLQTEKKGTKDSHSKLLTCDQCGNGYKTLGGLKRHQATHNKIGPRHVCIQSNKASVQNLGTISVESPQVSKEQGSRYITEDIITDGAVVQKNTNKDLVKEQQLFRTSSGKGSLELQSEENMVTFLPQNPDVTTESKPEKLLEQVLEDIASSEGQTPQVIVTEMVSHRSELDIVDKDQCLTSSAVTENATSAVAEHDNNITDLLLQDNSVKHLDASQQKLIPSGSQISVNEQITCMNLKPGVSLLNTMQDKSLTSSSAQMVNSKEIMTSGQAVNTPSEVTSGIRTIGHIKPAADVRTEDNPGHTKVAQLSDKHVRIKSHFSKEDIDMEVNDDPVFGLVSGLVKFCPNLSEADYTEVAKVTGVTVIMLDKQKIVVHGSWKALNRAYSMIENLQLEAKSSLQENCDDDDSPGVTVTAPVEGELQNGVDLGPMVTNDSDTEVTIETNPSVDLDSLDPISMMEPDTFLCDKCSKLFRSRRSLQEHIALRHMEHKCKMCSKVFSERRYLQTHLKRHANVRNYTCSICGWKFMERFKMKLHMESHKEIKDRCLPYKCTLCGKQFYNRASWSDHLNTHTGNRPYSCMLCGNTFAHRIGLKRHMTTHLKEKPYKCGQCDKSFSFRSKLADHMTMHTGISKHKCSHCDRIFTASSSLRRHMEQCPCKPPGQEVVVPEAMEMRIEGLQPTDSDTIYMCGICGETFDSLLKAEKHTVEHEQGASTEIENVVIQEEKNVVLDGVSIINEPQLPVQHQSVNRSLLKKVSEPQQSLLQESMDHNP